MKTQYLLRSLFPAILFCVASSLHAATLTVTEDFTYPSLGNGTSLSGNADGGSGWDGAWQGHSQILYSSTATVAYEAGNYPLPPLVSGAGSLYGQNGGFKSVYRDLESAISGEVWFSYAFRKSDEAAGGLLLNATSENIVSPTDWSVLIDGNDNSLDVTINGATTSVATVNPIDDYLIVGRFVTGSNGEFELWLNPDLSSVASLTSENLTVALSSVTPTFSDMDAIMPESISSLGLAAYREVGTGFAGVIRVDALWVEGTAIPEPNASTMLFLIVVFFSVAKVWHRRR